MKETAVPSPQAETLADDAAPTTVSVRAARLLGLLWNDRRIILRFVAVGFVVFIGLSLLRKNTYTSSAALLPPDNSGSSSNLLGMLASNPMAVASGSLFNLKTPGALFVGILTSHTVREYVIEKTDLMHALKLKQDWQVEAALTSMTSVSEDPKTGIIRIRVITQDPHLSCQIAQQYVAALDHVVTTNSTSQAHRERVFLEGRLGQIKQDLDASSKALSQFSARTKMFDVDKQAAGTADAGMKLQAELESARAELASLRQAYSDDNVRVKSASARVAELQRAENQMIGTSTNESPDATSSTLPSVGDLPVLGLTYADLERHVQVESLLWEALTKQYEAAKVQEAKEIPSVRMLDVPVVPDRKSGPARTIMVLLGTFFSFCLAIIVVLLRSMWRTMAPNDERKLVLSRIFTRRQRAAAAPRV